jgi:Protein phosphatase 2C
MQVTLASEPTPGRPNEDCAIVGPNWAAVLDGATAPTHIDSGCIHDVCWLVRELAGNLSRNLTLDPEIPLPEALAEAIGATCKSHEMTCDLTNPDSPSSTASIVRIRGDRLDYLTLADSPILLDTGTPEVPEVTVIVDDRTAHLSDYSYAGVSASRNTPTGFYVASTLPDAAYQAVYGSAPVDAVRAAALLTDGASRLADYFRHLTWTELFAHLITHGPRSLIAVTRHAERAGAGPIDGRRRKTHDDATVVFMSGHFLPTA